MIFIRNDTPIFSREEVTCIRDFTAHKKTSEIYSKVKLQFFMET